MVVVCLQRTKALEEIGVPATATRWQMRKVVIFALALLCAPAGLFGQALHPDSLFPRLIGHWVLRGTIARQQTVHDVTFEWLLGRAYVPMPQDRKSTPLNS